MPLVRYEVRCEHSLADPELYRPAGPDDPEGLLEGVAMAGLVGLIRQLGDLAEFAAEVFHDLHHDVMVIMARSHGLKARVTRLEADLPSVEKALLAEASQCRSAYTARARWRASLPIDQSQCSQGDLPRFVRSFSEACRGPPRLFLLDKFDPAGRGACVKRFTDPTFFRLAWATSQLEKAEQAQRERDPRQENKKSGSVDNGSSDTLPRHFSRERSSSVQLENPDANFSSPPLTPGRRRFGVGRRRPSGGSGRGSPARGAPLTISAKDIEGANPGPRFPTRPAGGAEGAPGAPAVDRSPMEHGVTGNVAKGPTLPGDPVAASTRNNHGNAAAPLPDIPPSEVCAGGTPPQNGDAGPAVGRGSPPPLGRPMEVADGEVGARARELSPRPLDEPTKARGNTPHVGAPHEGRAPEGPAHDGYESHGLSSDPSSPFAPPVGVVDDEGDYTSSASSSPRGAGAFCALHSPPESPLRSAVGSAVGSPGRYATSFRSDRGGGPSSPPITPVLAPSPTSSRCLSPARAHRGGPESAPHSPPSPPTSPPPAGPSLPVFPSRRLSVASSTTTDMSPGRNLHAAPSASNDGARSEDESHRP